MRRLLVLVGTTVGSSVGWWVGSLFGGTPRSSAEIAWTNGQFTLANVTSKNGGSKEAVRSLAGAVAGMLNGMIEASHSKVLEVPDRISGTAQWTRVFENWL